MKFPATGVSHVENGTCLLIDADAGPFVNQVPGVDKT